MSLVLPMLLALGLASAPVQAQKVYLDATLEPVNKGKAVYYLEPGGSDGTGGYLADLYYMDGTLKAKGRYADDQYRVPDGHFVFFHPNGKIESEGNYVQGWKDGPWTRKDKWGRELAEKIYDAEPLRNIVYTMAQTMPRYPGGEKAMVQYVRDRVGKPSGDVMATFVVEKDGRLSGVEVTGAENEQVADQIASAISEAPRWTAGSQDGQPVRVQMRVPLK